MCSFTSTISTLCFLLCWSLIWPPLSSPARLLCLFVVKFGGRCYELKIHHAEHCSWKQQERNDIFSSYRKFVYMWAQKCCAIHWKNPQHCSCAFCVSHIVIVLIDKMLKLQLMLVRIPDWPLCGKTRGSVSGNGVKAHKSRLPNHQVNIFLATCCFCVGQLCLSAHRIKLSSAVIYLNAQALITSQIQ